MKAPLAVAEAQARLLGLAGPLPIEMVPLIEAAGRYLADPLIARRNQPAADLSAMDGYALRFAELPGPFTVVGESAAGRALGRPLAPGEAARIFTGAPIPVGADTILVQEEAERDGATLRLAGEGPGRVGVHTRAIGSDFAEGTTLIDAGKRLTAPRIALAAIGGHGTLAVRRRPRVVLLSTGDELVLPGQPAPAPLLPASNAPMLAALLGQRAIDVADCGIVPDRIDALATAFADAARSADVIVTTGGVSVGDHDLVRPALEQAGADLDFWRVAMRPGKPLMAGRLGEALVIGLPGNPVAAFVTAQLFLLPMLRHLAGDIDPLLKARTLPLAAPVGPTHDRADYLRARLVSGGVEPFPSTDSAALAELALADALIVRPARSAAADAGTLCDVLDLT